MSLTRTELRSRLVKVASLVVTLDEAEYFADETIEAHIRKAPRANCLKASIDDLAAAIKIKDQKPEYKVDLPSFVSIDFHGAGPLAYIKQVHDELADRANKNGLAMAAFTNSKSMHTLHAWVQGLAKRGFVAIAVCNGGPGAVVPFNGTKGLFGTNPIAFGVPGENGDIHCVDMATSEIPYFDILDANSSKTPLQEHAAVDQKGEFTTDASEALDSSKSATDPISNIVPMGGGYKGYYIIYLLELLTSALIGMPSSPEMSSDFVAEEHGAILIAFSPGAMNAKDSFNATVSTLHAALKSQPAKTGESIRIPGEQNNGRFAEADETIEIDESLIKKLEDLTSL